MIIRETDASAERRIAGELNRAWRRMQMLKKLKVEPSLPAVVPNPEPKLSSHAASVAAHVEQLELDLEAARAELREEANARVVAERMLDEVRRENTHLLNERDHVQRQHIELHTRLSAAADVLVKCLDLRRPVEPAPPASVVPVPEEVKMEDPH